MTGQALGRQAHAIRACAGLVDVEEVEARDLLEFDITSHFDVGPIPELVQANLLTGSEPLEPQAARAFQSPFGPLRELLDGRRAMKCGTSAAL